MLRVIGSITLQHDLRLVVLAGLLCLFSCATAMGMIARARVLSDGRHRSFWLCAAGTVAGCGIWGAHFIAMLAFDAGLPTGYQEGLTVLSVIVAVVLCSAGFAVALIPGKEILGGAIIGAAISAMHYIGMAAVRISADAVWDVSYVIASVVIGVVPAAVGMRVALRGRAMAEYAQGLLLFALAIMGMHFAGMAAVTFVPNPLLEVPGTVLDHASLAVAVAAGAILIVALGLTGVIVDSTLSRRTLDEAERLNAYLRELETTKTRLEQVSADLRVALHAADAANRTKSQFLTNISHEIRTPMNAVIGMADLLARSEMTQRQHRFVEAIQHGGRSLLALISDILDFSKAETEGVTLHETEVDIGTVVSETATFLQDLAEGKGIALHRHIDDGVPPRLRTDDARLRQILIHLVNNAIKFTPEGKVELDVSFRYDGQNNGVAKFVVSDTGIGIAAKDQERIFGAFEQVDASSTRNFGGAGLGLAITRKLVEAMGGTIGVESKLGAGSTFTVLIPMTVPNARNIPLAARSRIAGTGI